MGGRISRVEEVRGCFDSGSKIVLFHVFKFACQVEGEGKSLQPITGSGSGSHETGFSSFKVSHSNACHRF